MTVETASRPRGTGAPASAPVRLAVNYSPAAAALAGGGAVEIDLFKCPPWPEVVAEAGRLREVFVHFDLTVGDGVPPAAALEEAERWVERTATPYVNAHLAPAAGSLPATGAVAAALRRARDGVEALAARFGRHRLALENVPWERRAGYEIHPVAAEPEMVKRAVAQGDCGLLLDLAHARLAAEERGEAIRPYVEGLPTDRLVELHVTGLGSDEEGRRRDHMPMTGEDYGLLQWALEQIADGRWRRPWAVVLEYGGVGPLFAWRSEEAVLARDLPRIAGLLRRVGLRP